MFTRPKHQRVMAGAVEGDAGEIFVGGAVGPDVFFWKMAGEPGNHMKPPITPPKIYESNLKMMVWKMIFPFQGCILRFHVNLLGCISQYIRIQEI